MSDIDVLNTDDESFQDSGSEYLPYESNRSYYSNEVDSNEITQEVDKMKLFKTLLQMKIHGRII